MYCKAVRHQRARITISYFFSLWIEHSTDLSSTNLRLLVSFLKSIVVLSRSRATSSIASVDCSWSNCKGLNALLSALTYPLAASYVCLTM